MADCLGMTLTLDRPGWLSRAVVGRAIREPTPDVDPDATVVPFLRHLAGLLVRGWEGPAERFGEKCEWSRGEWGGEDVRDGEVRIGAGARHVLVRHQYREPEQEMFPVPRTEWRSYAVSGLPEGSRLTALVEREWKGGNLVQGRLQVRFFVPGPLEEPVVVAFRAAFESGAPKPRVLGLVAPEAPEALRDAWERVVRARHGGADLAALADCLRPLAPKSLESWERTAGREPRAACLAGDCHRCGVGVRRADPVRAESLYRKAAAAGDLTGMVNLAELLDEKAEASAAAEALDLVRRAAEAGEARAQGVLGQRYAAGTGGVGKRPAAALRWLKRGAKGDDARSQTYLAALLLKSEPAAAERWLRRAAERGDPAAAFDLGRLVSDPPARNVAPDHEEARIWFRRSARSGHAGARMRLGGASLACPQGDSTTARPTAERNHTAPRRRTRADARRDRAGELP